MDPIHALMTEHRIIEHALDSFTAFATRVANSNNDGRAELARYVAFFREFADRLHHQKEEEILFAEMVNHGFPGEVGPVACMLHEHVEGRMWVARLDGLARADQAWGSEERRGLAISAAHYAALLRTHIKKEDHALYPMAENHLTAVTLEEIGKRIAAVDASPDAAIARAALIDLGIMMDENTHGTVAETPAHQTAHAPPQCSPQSPRPAPAKKNASTALPSRPPLLSLERDQF